MSDAAHRVPPVPPLPERLRLGVSACLLGEEVRHDGNHKRDGYVTGTLARHFELVSVCPEVAVGLGVPRPPLRLEGTPEAPRAVGVYRRDLDATDALTAYGERMGEELQGLAGYLLKAGSPSCGMERVRVYRPEGGAPARKGMGLYAAALRARQPLLPMEEEGRLGDPVLRDTFVERVFAHARWRHLVAQGLTPGGLVAFHTAHKLTLLSRGQPAYRALGRLAATAGERRPDELAAEYGPAFFAALARPPTPRRHANVLHHLLGYLKRHLDGGDKAELLEAIEAHRQERVPLIVPLTLLRHHFRRHPHPYVANQVYLYPDPRESLLRWGV